MAASVALLVGAHFVLGLGETVIIYILTHWGWHCSFYSSAGIGLVVGLMWFLLVRDTLRQHPLVTTEDVSRIEAGIPVATDGQERPLPWSAILSSRNV